ncbi:MAG: dipeptidase PepE [Cytophagales bacterium]|nr:dipeptidase PepE [Cytophagales bacterium]
MSNRRLLLLSNSTNYGETYLKYPKESISKFLEKDNEEILFIPYAGVGFSYDMYTEKVALPFSELGYRIIGIHTFPDPKQAVMDAEVIAVGGGNTFELLNQLYANKLVEVIQERVNSGVPYMGWSAGSNVASPSIKTTNDMPIVEPPSFNALNLVPFQINPHYTEAQLPNHGGETRKDRIKEFLHLNQDDAVIGIPEGNLLEISDNSCKLRGDDIIKVFKYGAEILNLSSKDNLDFLLE